MEASLHGALSKLNLPPEKVKQVSDAMLQCHQDGGSASMKTLEASLPQSEFLRGAVFGILHYIAASRGVRGAGSTTCSTVVSPSSDGLATPTVISRAQSAAVPSSSRMSVQSPPKQWVARAFSEDNCISEATTAAAQSSAPKRSSRVKKFLRKMLLKAGPGGEGSSSMSVDARNNNRLTEHMATESRSLQSSSEVCHETHISHKSSKRYDILCSIM